VEDIFIDRRLSESIVN